ncbi:DnaA regulatory inactivator Hda [Aliiroseovarius halocynthiae]|uniref:Chromosomal replication initiator DnaA n=1 Tax=Aliiroseovarius halocynthiae TaxID=985055 RepID=A0A545SM66_9RHOB|nr:DnaA/Hda family protein [Aliiroseovarius halocynthiae]TQV66064.1 chromosomal replication initiator DnaA [Aliiroseovarius halocynthiae]SMR83228.1 DnaA regulatory inactivator Hda [Aliiroseovarius halocynthiae]
MAEQLTFDLPARPAQGLDDFLVTPSNANAMATIESWENWPNSKLVLVGDEGTGKTHLTHVWAGLTGAQIIPARDLPQTRVEDLAGRSIALEDADQIAGQADAENALFHLHNLVLAEGGALLLTARTAPSRWGLTLPDLRSRMEGTTLARLDPPDDMLLSAVLVKLFHDRQITVPLNLIDYLLPRMERSLAEASRVVSVLDQAALSEGRALTRTLAARVLDNSE